MEVSNVDGVDAEEERAKDSDSVFINHDLFVSGSGRLDRG